jgi:hypothetical protein
MCCSPDTVRGKLIKVDELGVAYSTYGGRELRTTFLWGNLRHRDQLENLGVDDRMMLSCFVNEVGGRGLD